MTIKHREVVSELKGALSSLRQAIVTDDVENWSEMFWAINEVTRFGLGENLYGPNELEAFRKLRPATNLAHTVKRLVMSASTMILRPLRFNLSAQPELFREGSAEPGAGRNAGGLAHCFRPCFPFANGLNRRIKRKVYGQNL